MKSRFFFSVHVFPILAVLLLSGCGGEPQMMLEPEASIVIVRFKNPAYTKNVIVWGNDNMAHLTLMRGNACERTFWRDFPTRDYDGSLFLGETDTVKFKERYRDPFWALPDGWYLIDWAWHGIGAMAYPYLGNTILTDVTFENLYEYGTCNFDKSVPHKAFARDDLYEKKEIFVSDLMAYMHPDGNYPSFQLYMPHSHPYSETGNDTILESPNQYSYHTSLSHVPYASNVTTCLCELDDQMDAYWATLQNQLATLINNGDLNNLKRFDVKTLNR